MNRWHAPLIVGCAVWASLLPWVPRGPSLCRVVIEGAGAAAPGDGQAAGTGRSLLVPAGSPTLRRLEAVVAASRTRSRQPRPPAYYAERWRMVAAAYYADRDRRGERSGCSEEPRDLGDGDLGDGGSAEAPSTDAEGSVEQVTYAVPSAGERPRIDATYWEAERRRAERAAARLLASLPVSDAAQGGLHVSVGETLPGRPRRAGLGALFALAALAALGMTYWPAAGARQTARGADGLQAAASGASGANGECLELPAEWVVQRRPLVARLHRGVVVMAWGLFAWGILGGSG